MPAEQSPATDTPPAPESPAAPGPAGDESAPRGRAVSNGLAWLLTATICYALSPLPMGVALDLLPYGASRELHPRIQRLYAPLTWLYERNTRVHEFYDWYEGLLDS